MRLSKGNLGRESMDGSSKKRFTRQSRDLPLHECPSVSFVFSWNEAFLVLHFVHLRNISWDRNVQLPTWHCLDLHCQSIYTWPWGLSWHRDQCCCSGTCSFHYSRGPGPKGAHSAASLLGAEWDLFVSGPGTLCPKKRCSAETRWAHLGGHGQIAHLPSSCPCCSRYTHRCWHFQHEPLFLLFPFESLTFNSAERKNTLCFSSSVTDMTIKKSFSDKSIIEYKSKHYIVVFTYGLCRSCEVAHTVTASCLTQH